MIRMVYYSAQFKASIAFVILNFMVSDCLSIPIHINRTASQNSFISVVHLNSFSQQLNEGDLTMKAYYGSKSEMKLKSDGTQTRSNVASPKNAETSVTNSINSSLAEEDSHDSMQTVRSKRLTHIDIPNIIQEYVNYLLNYSTSHMHPIPKKDIYLHINGIKWDEWNVIAMCPTNYSVSHVCQKRSSTSHTSQALLKAVCACKFARCHQVHAKVRHHLHSHPVGCVHATQRSSKQVNQQYVPPTVS